MVKCKDCGYLAVRNLTNRQLMEAEGGFRDTANIPLADIYSGRPHTQHEPRPICFVQSVDLIDEIKGSYGKEGIVKNETGYVLEAIGKERGCNEFTKWRQGFTPKEHREMLDRQWMLEREDRRDRDARRMRYAEFFVAVIALGIIVWAAFIERSGQPTINIINPSQDNVTIEK